VPVIPAWIEAGNSLLFHLAGKINPLLRTALLPHELFNKKNKKIHIQIGSLIKPQTVSELTNLKEYGNFLRANVTYLQKEKKTQKIRIGMGEKSRPATSTIFRNSYFNIRTRRGKSLPATSIINPVAVELLCNEIEAIRESSYLLSRDNYELYLVAPDTAPNILKEIGRLRELTFRSIGEGTLQEADNDNYDAYYHQLFIWDSDAKTIVGAYRMGFGNQILKQFGLPGFYIRSLFRIEQSMTPHLAKTIELGRSFITLEYQRKAHPLLLLWKGILHVLITHPEYEYLLGATSIAGNYSSASKLLMVNFLKKHHYNRELSVFIKPVNGMKGIRTGLNLSLVENIKSIELIKKLITDMEDQERTMPVLIRKYLQLNSRVLAFNVDHDFCDALDALILLEVKGMSEEMIKMINR
jgi:putative hemolysin